MAKRWSGRAWQVHTGNEDIPLPSIIKTGKGLNVPTSFTIAVTLSLGLKGLIPIKMNRPLGGALHMLLGVV